MKAIMVTVALVAVGSMVHADDGGLSGAGGSLELIKPEHSSIRMVREKVDVRLDLKGAYNTSPHVRCEFVFRNEGKATTVKMGFPEFSSGADAPGLGAKGSELSNFRSWVDGKPVKTRLVTSTKNSDQSYKAWHVKDVPFAAGQTRTVVNTYDGGWAADVSGYIGFIYVLKTGASWKGPIGSAVINVDVGNIPSRYRMDGISPKGYTRRGNVISWHLRNLEPDEDIEVGFVPAVRILFNDTEMFGMLHDRKNKTSMVSARYLADPLGIARTEWRSGRSTIFANGHKLEMTPGSRVAVLDGKKEINLPVAPYIDKGQTIIPLAAVVRALGGNAGMVKLESGEFLSFSL